MYDLILQTCMVILPDLPAILVPPILMILAQLLTGERE